MFDPTRATKWLRKTLGRCLEPTDFFSKEGNRSANLLVIAVAPNHNKNKKRKNDQEMPAVYYENHPTAVTSKHAPASRRSASPSSRQAARRPPHNTPIVTRNPCTLVSGGLAVSYHTEKAHARTRLSQNREEGIPKTKKKRNKGREIDHPLCIMAAFITKTPTDANIFI